MGYAFISYSTVNQSAADALRMHFQENGISVWMAPYDIPAGCEYADVICDALSGCACLVLVLTANSQDSVWVKKEINLAVSDRKPIIPVKLDEIVLNNSMRLYLNDRQIIPVNELDENSEEMKKVIKAVCAYTDVISETKNISGVKISEESEAVEITDSWECYRRGYCFELGENTEVDLVKAAYWYEIGAKQGNAWCQHRMGEFCLLGLGRAQDYEEAVKWYMLGAAQDDSSCCARLAECYENGWGLPKNVELAADWRIREKRSK